MDSGLASSKWRIPLVVSSSILLFFGSCSGPVFTRLYFLHGGKSRWLTAILQTCACPIILIPLIISYINRRSHGGDHSNAFFLMKSFLYKSSAFAGFLYGVIDVFYAYDSSYLPVSTSSLIISSQLAFVAFFAFFLVNQKFNVYSMNTIASLTLGAAILGLQSSSDTPQGESVTTYVVGLVLMLMVALLNAFAMPFIEFSYKKANQEISYTMVMEFNMMMCAFATAFCALGWFISNDYKGIVQEAKAFDLGENKYYFVTALVSISWQCYILGTIGVIFCSSSLLCGILLTCAIPLTEMLGVFFFDEKFNIPKGISLVLSIWGFLTYFYGELKYSNEANKSSHGSPLISTQSDDDGIAC